MVELKRGGHARVHTEMVEFIALPFPSSKKLNIWSFQTFSRRSRAGKVKKCTKNGVLHVQRCCFAVAVVALQGPYYDSEGNENFIENNRFK